MAQHQIQENGALTPVSDVRGTNQSGMRAHNERLVLSLVRQHQALSKSEIARMTGLSAQTVSVIMRQLEQDGLLLRGEPVRGKVGQPSVPMRLDPEGASFLGLKIGRRSTELVLTDFLGHVRGRVGTTYPYPTPDATLDFVETHVSGLTSTMTQAQRARVAGIGIAMPFFLWQWAQTLGVPATKMDVWRHVDMQAEIAARYPGPVFLQNDATAACGAELVFGPADGPRDFLYFYVGFFIGGGVVLQGSIYSGRGNSGALGPLPVPDTSGQVQPLIDVASLCVLEKRLAAEGHPTEALWGPPSGWSVPSDILASWISDAARGLTHAIVSASSVIDFECVKIDGWIPGNVKTELIAAIDAEVSKFNLTGLVRPAIMAGTAGPDARALGAASLPLSAKYLVVA